MAANVTCIVWSVSDRFPLPLGRTPARSASLRSTLVTVLATCARTARYGPVLRLQLSAPPLILSCAQVANLLNSKCTSLYLQKKKPSKLKWTIAWRRLNKKMTVRSNTALDSCFLPISVHCSSSILTDARHHQAPCSPCREDTACHRWCFPGGGQLPLFSSCDNG